MYRASSPSRDGGGSRHRNWKVCVDIILYTVYIYVFVCVCVG